MQTGHRRRRRPAHRRRRGRRRGRSSGRRVGRRRRSASRSRGRASRRAPSSATPPAGFQPADPERPAYDWGAIDAAVDRLRAARGSSRCSCSTARRRCGRRATRRAATRATGRARPRSRTSPRRSPAATATAVDQYILWNEPNLPVWMQPQADCGKKRCTPGLAERLPRDGPRRLPGDPRGRPGRAGADRRARAGRRRPQEPTTRTCARWSSCAGWAASTATLHAVRTGACRDVPARARRRHRLPPAQHAPRAEPALRAPRQRRPRQPEEGRAPARPPAALGTACRATTTPLSLWLDEYGYQTNPPDKLRGVSPGAQDRYLQQAAYIAWRDPRVMLLAQYLWQDEPAARRAEVHRLAVGPARRRRRRRSRRSPTSTTRSGSTSATTSSGARSAPAARTPSTVQRRLAGGATSWETLATVPTGVDGSWQISDAAGRRSRRTARSPTTAPTSAAIDRGPARPASAGEDAADGGDDDALVERRTVGDGRRARRSRARSRASRWSTGRRQSYLGGTRPNPIFARLVQTLAAGGNGAPTIRIGGNSTDETWWNPAAAPRPAGRRDRRHARVARRPRPVDGAARARR